MISSIRYFLPSIVPKTIPVRSTGVQLRLQHVTIQTNFCPYNKSQRVANLLACHVVPSSVLSSLKAEAKNMSSSSQTKKLALPSTAEERRIDEIRELLKDQTINVNCVDVNGWTALHWYACSSNHPDIAEVLLDYGANVELRTFSYPGGTPLMLACGNGSLETVKLLLERGANVHGRNSNSYNPPSQQSK